MFDDGVTAPEPRSGPSFEDELRRLLDALAPVTVTAAPAALVVELTEDFRRHRARPVSAGRIGTGPQDAPAAPAPAPAPVARSDVAPSPRPEAAPNGDREDGFVPGALAWDAQFAAGATHLAEVRAAQAVIGREEARRARALAAFARSRPVSTDRPDAEIGAAAAATRAARPTTLAAVSEWAVDEVAVALSTTAAAASTLLVESLRLVLALPGTLTALEEGRITWPHVRVMADVVAPVRDDAVRAEAERRLLARVAGKTHTQLRDAARRVVTRLDAEAITERVKAAARERGVKLYPGEDAMGTLATVLPLPIARAVYDALEQYADAAATPGDERTKAQRMADCLVDLIVRPGEHGLAPVQAKLTIVAAVQTLLGGDEPGEIDGDLIPAAMVRELAVALGLMPAEGGESAEEPDTESADVDADKPSTEAGSAPATEPDLDCGAERAAVPGAVVGDEDAAETTDRAAARLAALADLLDIRSISGTALAHRPHLALGDQATGALVCLTDATGLRSAARAGRGLRPPPRSPGYRPSDALERFVRHRDRRCRFPGCRARAQRCDLDHTIPWPHGVTSADNLCCLCRHHHRLSHQAPGWSLRGLPDGRLRWTTPTGQVLTTHPPGTARTTTHRPSIHGPGRHPGPTRTTLRRSRDTGPSGWCQAADRREAAECAVAAPSVVVLDPGSKPLPGPPGGVSAEPRVPLVRPGGEVAGRCPHDGAR